LTSSTIFSSPLAAARPSSKEVKPKQARFLFKKWLSFEEGLAAANGDEKMVEEVNP
jgi:rRNA biogenesis protein RRP5